jgi:serine/threonine-protein kinase
MRTLLRGIAIFLALVGVGVVSAFAVVALMLRQEEVRVPDLTGQDIVSVIETVRQLGLVLRVERREPSPTMPRDTVISQMPAPGTGTKKDREVRVIVSQGPSDLLAPKLVGENYRKADLVIRQSGFTPGDSARVYSDTVERDTVIAQSPQAGSPLEKGGTITLLVSAGKRAEEALKIVDRLGLQHRVLARALPDRPAGGERVVISQRPSAGYPVSTDATVDIVVSK